MPIVDYNHKAEVTIKRFFNNTEISQKNKDNTKKYLDAIDVKPARIDIILTHLRLLFLKCDDLIYQSNDRDFINQLFKSYKGTFSDSYLETLKNVGKAFVRWHNDGETPKGWKDIKRAGKNSQRRDLSPKDMITWEDGLKIVEKTRSTQLKAIIMTQLDGGFRPSEFIDMNYGDLTKEGKYYTAKVNGKTGKRDVILFKCIPHLERWLREHPIKKDKSPLWLTEMPKYSKRKNADDRYDYFAIVKRLRIIAKSLNISKPLDFYNLRHSSAVIKKLDNIPVDICALNMGHSVKHFVEVYGRLSLKDLTNRYDKAYGLKKAEDEQKNPIVCQFCNTTNEPKIDYCVQCGNPLTLSVAVSERKKLAYISELINDSEKFEKITRAIEMINKKSI